MCLTKKEVEKLLGLIQNEMDRTSVKLYLENIENVRNAEYVRKMEEMVYKKTDFQLWQENRIKELNAIQKRGATEEEKKQMRENLMKAGIVDENGELTEPYRLE